MQEDEQRSPAARAFGVAPPPWYKGRSSGAPGALTAVIGAVSLPLASLASSIADGVLRIVLWGIVAIGPSWLIVSFYRERQRRGEEAVLPTGDDDPPAWLPRALKPRED